MYVYIHTHVLYNNSLLYVALTVIPIVFSRWVLPRCVLFQHIVAETRCPPFLQTTSSNAFSWMKTFEFQMELHWNMFLGVYLTINHHWLRQWVVAEQATSHYLNQWWHSLQTHICITRPQWVSISKTTIKIGKMWHIVDVYNMFFYFNVTFGLSLTKMYWYCEYANALFCGQKWLQVDVWWIRVMGGV